ncbi:hypothetical protein [Spirillospora sp. NPDC029432]|uniref:hypothetical protein n=1 Tax=Spirillospora sp. NPDC029432 TaxID=3154599 RepID=UPI00345247E1
MSGAVTVYVPCDVVSIAVRMGYGDSLSLMEELVLRAVHAGLIEPDQLAQRLGLGARLVHDLVYDLWRQGHLTIATAVSPPTLAVSATVARCLDTGDLKRLRGAESIQDNREVMIDKLTLRVLPASGRSRPPRSRLAVPVEDRRVRLEDAPRSAVLKALDESLRRDQANRPVAVDRAHGPVVGHRALRPLSYRLPPPDLRKAAGRRWIELKVAPHWDEDLRQLTVTVVDGRWPAEYRQEASDQLTRLVADAPNGPLAVELRNQAQDTLVDPPTPAAALKRLEHRIEVAADIPAGQRRNWHLELADDARQLEELLRAQVGREIRARAVTGKEQEDLLVRLVREARTQLVIVSPWIGYPALARLLDALADRARHGVRIVFVWGSDGNREYQEEFDEQTRNALEDLARSASGDHSDQILIPRTSARTHAKLLLVDDRTALVTSRNLLSSTGSLSELGVLLEAAEGGSPIITELLGWARAAIPSYEQSRRILIRPADFAAAGGATSDGDAGRDEPPGGTGGETGIAPPDEDPADPRAESASRAFWTKAWREHAARSRAFLEGRALPSGRPVTDAVHRALLRTALAKATRRVVIASHGLSAEAVDTGLLGALRSCLDREVEVTLVYGNGKRLTGPARDSWDLAGTRLEDLKREYPGRLRLICDSNHAKVLVWDDEAVVGSFNYLSFEGRYGRQRLGSELSVRLTGGGIADEVAAAVGAAPLPRPEQSRPRPPATAGTAFNAAQRLLKIYKDGAASAPAAVRDALARADDPWRLLDALGEEPDTPPALVKLVAARCLTDHTPPGETFSQSTSRWHRWLIDHLWRNGDFVEAAVLRHALADPRLRPRHRLAMLAAARGTPALVTALEDLAVDDPDADERVVGVLAATGAVALQGSHAAADALDLLAADIDPLWKDLAERTAGYWAGSGGQAITRELLRDALHSSQRDQERAEAWITLERLLEHARSSTFENAASIRTHRALFESSSGEFAVLAKRVRERSPGTLRPWLADLPTRNMTQLVQNVGAKVSPGKPPMYGNHLKRYVKRLDPILAQADTVLRLCEDAEPGAKVTLPREAPELAGWIVESWSGFTQYIGEMAAPEGRLARAFLDDLEELTRWGAQLDDD